MHSDIWKFFCQSIPWSFKGGMEFLQEKKCFYQKNGDVRASWTGTDTIASRIHCFQQLFSVINKLKLGRSNGQRAGYSHSTVIKLTGRILLWKYLSGFWPRVFPLMLKESLNLWLQATGKSWDNRKPSYVEILKAARAGILLHTEWVVRSPGSLLLPKFWSLPFQKVIWRELESK